MNLLKKSYYNFIFVILLFFTMSIGCLKAPAICVLAADISASVDYSEYTLKINGIKDGSFTINTYKDKSAEAVKKTYTYEVSTASAEVDSTKDLLNIIDTLNEKGITVIGTGQPYSTVRACGAEN